MIICDHIFCTKPYAKRADRFYKQTIGNKSFYFARCEAHFVLKQNDDFIIEISEEVYETYLVIES